MQAGRRRIEARVDGQRVARTSPKFSAVVCWTRPRQDSSSNAPRALSTSIAGGRDKTPPAAVTSSRRARRTPRSSSPRARRAASSRRPRASARLAAAAARRARAVPGRARRRLDAARALPRSGPGVDWARTDVFFGDERAVPPDDPQSNYRMARETLLDPAQRPRRERVPLARRGPRSRRRRARLRGGAAAAARAPWLDLALLGLGPDGHTASLFPGTAALAEEARLAVAVDVPALGTRRLTLTYPALLGAREVFFLVTGRDKAEALVDGLARGATSPPRGSSQRAARCRIFCERAAAARSHGYRNEGAHDRSGRRHRRHQHPARDLRRSPAAGTRRDAALRAAPIPRRRYPSLDVIAEAFLATPRPRSAPARGRERLLRHRRADREQHVPRHQPPLGRRRPGAVRAPRHRSPSRW